MLDPVGTEMPILQVREQELGDVSAMHVSGVAEAHSRVPVDSIVTFWKGRVALFTVLKSLGVGHGDVVLVPGFTCFAVPAAVSFTGATPVYADIDPATYNVTLASLQRAWDVAPAGAVRVVLVQHTFGVPAELEAISRWAGERQIAVVEDCAHVLGSRLRDSHGIWRELGSFGDAAIFSSQWTKPVSTGLGGWARINRPDLLANVKKFWRGACVSPSVMEVTSLAAQVAARAVFSAPSLSWRAKAWYQRLYTAGVVTGTSSPDELRGTMPTDYAKRMCGFQEWLLRRRLGDLSVQQHRRYLKNCYDAALRKVNLSTIDFPEGVDAVLLRYPVRVSDKKRTIAEARRRGIDLGDWYKHPIDVPQGLSAETFGYHAGMCEQGERAANELVNLPMHPGMDERAVAKIVQFVREMS